MVRLVRLGIIFKNPHTWDIKQQSPYLPYIIICREEVELHLVNSVCFTASSQFSDRWDEALFKSHIRNVRA
jgi:hypothetical protein